MSSFCLAIKLASYYAILALEGTILLKGNVIFSRKERIRPGVGAFLYLHLVATEAAIRSRRSLGQRDAQLRWKCNLRLSRHPHEGERDGVKSQERAIAMRGLRS